MINPTFSSGVATVLQRYVGMKRALGPQFDSATHALQSMDRLLTKEGERLCFRSLVQDPGAYGIRCPPCSHA